MPVVAPAGVSPRFWSLLVAERLEGTCVLDVGTGAGRLALALSPLCDRVMGIDHEPSAVDEARRAARTAGRSNVEFVVADAETIDYRELFAGAAPRGPDVVVAHLYLSDRLVEKSARALAPGGALAFVGFHTDQWRETGRPSRFAYDEERVRTLLDGCGFVTEHLEVERQVQEFRSVEEGLAAAIGLQERWKADGRWFRYLRFLEEGGRSLTRSHLIVKARRR